MPAPCRNHLRAYLFHAARWFLGRDELCRDPITITIHCENQKETVRFDSMPDDGAALPVVEAERTTTNFASILWDCALSPDEKRIVAVVASRGPVPTKTIWRETGLAKSRGAVLVANLRERGVLGATVDGYQVTASVWHLIAIQQAPNNAPGCVQQDTAA